MFEQPGQASLGGEPPMLDFMFAVRPPSTVAPLLSAPSQSPALPCAAQVEDPLTWHAANLDRNRHHYSALGAAGPSAVVRPSHPRQRHPSRDDHAACSRARLPAPPPRRCSQLWVADGLGAGVHFNTLVPWRGRAIKYGVLSEVALAADLEQWGALYAAGRMQARPLSSPRQRCPWALSVHRPSAVQLLHADRPPPPRRPAHAEAGGDAGGPQPAAAVRGRG